MRGLSDVKNGQSTALNRRLIYIQVIQNSTNPNEVFFLRKSVLWLMNMDHLYNPFVHCEAHLTGSNYSNSANLLSSHCKLLLQHTTINTPNYSLFK